jgi:choline transporter-like protein 2/4/5
VLRFLVGIFVWLTIFIVFGLLIFGIGWSYIKYKELEDEPKTPTTTLETFTYQKKTYLALGIIFVVVFLILLLIVICLRQRIQIAIQLIKEASRAISNMWFTLLFPIVTFFLLVVVIVWFITVALYPPKSVLRCFLFWHAFIIRISGIAIVIS